MITKMHVNVEIPSCENPSYECQNMSKLLLYNDRSWISRFATCQLISRDWKNLHKTSPAGKIHHSLSSLRTTTINNHSYFSVLSMALLPNNEMNIFSKLKFPHMPTFQDWKFGSGGDGALWWKYPQRNAITWKKIR